MRGTRFGGPPQKRGTSSNPGGCWFRLTEQENQTESSEEPTEVRRVGDTSAVPCCCSSQAQELHSDPYPEKYPSWDGHDADEIEEHDKRFDTRLRVQNEIRAHDSTNRA